MNAIMEKTGSKPIDELVRLAIIGDGTAFTALWDNNIDSLKQYLKATIKGLDDFFIDDICSRSFEKAFRQIGSFDPSRSQFSTWLHTIAHNTALDTMESEKRARREMFSLDSNLSIGQQAQDMSDSQDNALDSIIRDEESERTRVYIEALPPLYREIAFKRMVSGMQYKEIADELGMELNTVRTRIRRAKQLIENMKDEQDV